MYHLRKLKSLLLLLLVAVTAKAQLSDGKVYNFVNVGKGTSMSITANDVIVTLPDERKYSQLWYAASEGNGFTLRNLANGHYLKSPNATSEAWSTVKVKDENCIFTATSVGGNYAIRVTGNSGGYNYMHADGGNTIVCWESSVANSQWTMNVVNIDAAILNANWNELASIDPSAETTATYQTHLDNLFSDKACTTLKGTYASMSESTLKSQAAYQNLPSALQNMVLKVRNNSWGEGNYDASKSSWDADYAKRYRVQLYEPYNEPEAAASALGINAHTNLNNPTGIFANDREALYVMVGGEIGAGASLYITSYTGNGNLGGYDNGIELKQGLNIIPSFGNGNNYCINYVVHTFDTSKGKGNKAKAYRLSAFDDLKIHIEGGYINGYYNKVGDDLYTPDQGANWDYLEARATQTTVTILGKYITLQFPLNDAVDNDGKTNKGMSYYLDQSNVKGIIDEWDNVMLWERLVLGLLDEKTINAEAKESPYSTEERVFDYTGNDGEFAAGYEDYYNVHGLSLGVGYNYMYGGWDHCGYHYNTMESILTNLPYNAGSHWGPGHEIGHQHQKLLTVNGLTEVTNNLFSNVVLWYYGETTSRVNGDEGSLNHVLAAFNTEGSDFFTNNIWALTHMYYKLFLYYHVLGHNTKFYPRLFEMLRQDPMSGGYDQNGATSLLHFYKKCCLASGDDLTEFFRAYGFFSVMDNRLVGDYDNSVYTTTQADIDAAIKDVKDLGYDENIAVLFINDATGETIKSHKGDNLELYGETTVCAEVGGYASFADNTTPDYTYSVSGTTVTMEGEGGTGFAIFNERGEIIAFSDKKTFTISEECAVALASGKAEVMAVKADNTPVEVVDVMDTDNTEAKYAALGELLNAVKAVTNLADATGTKVGYYRSDLLTDLQDAYETAKTVYDNETVASYNAVYDVLYQEYANVIADDFARIGIIEGNAYRLKNRAYTDRSMAVNTSNNQMSGVTTANTDEQKWYFEASNSLGRYYLKNKSTSLYPGDVSSGTVLSADKAADTKGNDKGAYAYELRDMGNGLWALVGSKGLHCSSSQSYNIVGWGADAEASQWYITAVEVDQNAETLYELQNLIAKTEALVDEIATVQGKGTAVELSAENITSNATESGHETKYLLDGKVDTYFHTVWKESTVSEPHYLQVDLGESKSLAEFVWTYTTYNTTWGADFPATVEVAGSADNQLWHDIATLSDLPRTKGEDFESVTLGSSNQSYRYLRFTVTATSSNGKFNNQYYFGLGEMGLTRMSTFVESIGDKYANFITAEKVASVCDQVYAVQQAIASGSATSDDVAALQAQYDILLAAYENANNVEFNAKKEELLALISSTNSLINECGTITYIPATLDGALALQTNNPNGSWYVSSNADQNTGGGGNDGGGIAALVDNNYDTYFHTRWGGTIVSEPHHIQVDMGNGVAINDFVFSYKPRNNSPAPTSMIVYGSNDENSFTEVLATIESGLPAHDSGNTYTSSTIVSDKAYRYLRFTVTGSQGPGNNIYGGQFFFGMLEFDLTAVGRPESYTAELGAQAGEATTDLLLATYHAVNAAQEVCNEAITESQLQNAITALQANYDALHSAMYPNVEYKISVVGAANGAIQYDGQNYTESLSAPTTLTVGELTAIVLDGYTEGVITLDVVNKTITVTYNKIYTVQVEGVVGVGGVVLGDASYTHGETFDALNLEVDDLDAIDLTKVGYAAESITIDGAIVTVIYNKVYTVSINEGEGERYVSYNGHDYRHGETFNVQQYSFTAEDLGVNEITGYLSTVTVDHVTGAVTVTYTLDKTALVNLIGETDALMSTCQGFVNSAYVTDQLLIKTSTAIGTAQENLKKDLTYAEYTAAVTALQDAYNTLNTAKDSAEAEANERTVLNGQLSELISKTETLIASCYDNDVLKYVNSDYVTEESLNAVRALVAEAETKCASQGTTADEYRASISALTEAKSNLVTAIKNAEKEIVVRNELKSQLLALIGDTETLIASCYDNDVLKYVNSDYVTEESLNAVRALVAEAETKCANQGTTADEYRASISALTEAKSNLATAIENAEKEAAERDEQRAILNDLIAAATELIRRCETTPGDATEALMAEVNEAITSAQTVANEKGSTVEQLTTETAALQSKYDVLVAAQQSTAKAELRALIAKTTALIERCGTVEYSRTKNPVALQTDDVNADFWLSTNAQETTEGAIPNLVGKVDKHGFFHSSWSDKVGTDEVAVAHYLQVDMGASHALKEFAFSYTTRNNGKNGPHPSTIVVSGSNDKDGSFVDLVTFDELPIEGNASWNATYEQVITASEAYRYLRFTVTASAGTNGCQHGNGEYYFAMARFSLVSVGEEGWNVYLNANACRVTEEQLLTIYQANIAAETLADESADKDALLEEKEDLQALYDALLEATLPVVLTTDTNVPALYVIKTKRGGNPVLQYDAGSQLFGVATAVEKESAQAFYFMKGDETAEGTLQVYIYPYMAEGKVLAADDVDDGAGKALAKEKGTATYEQWVFVNQAEGYYNLQPAASSTYLSNIYGTDYKMGFYSSNPSGDPGSLFMFEQTTVVGGHNYLKLKDYYNHQTKVRSTIEGSPAVGYYPVDQAEVYNAAYSAATEALANVETTTEEECQTIYDDLVAANEALVMNMPSADKFYRFVSADTKNGRVDGVVYADPDDNKMHWSKDKGASDATAIWTIAPADNGGYHITNLHTGLSISEFISNDPTPLSESANAASFVSLSGDGQVKVVCNGTMHAQSGGAVVTWNTGANDASAWRIEEVGHVAKIGTYNYTSLYLNYPTTIPADVEAYIAKNVKKEADEEYATIDLVKLNGNVLPAQTGVILYSATPGDYNFLYTANEATDNVGENLLEGSDRVQYIGDETGTYKYYIFGRSGGEVGLYWAKMDYNADGTSAGGTDRGNYFKASANKVYLKLEVQPGTALSGFRFRIGNEVTGLEDVTIGADTVIYDLYGRRILEVVTPGLYIINGEKRYINIK